MKRFIFAILFIVLLISSGFGLSFSGFDSKDSDIVVSGDSFCYMVRDLGDGYSVLESFSYSVDDHFSGCNLSIHRVDDSWVLSSGDSIKCSNDVVERNFTLNGSKVWLFKIVLYEPAKLLNFLSVYYTLRTTRAIVAHNHAVNFFAILNESGKPIITLPFTLEMIGFYTDVHPLFYHVKDYTKDNLNMVF
ncbi:MAG TPA: hypothetical protein ENI44_02120 [Thermoplasmatales archaeon]|nr:hypothetical protein [Thermoplasmatales archaeon]